MAQALASDPYNPEDHMLTADEMWGGLSDDEAAVDEAAAAQSRVAQPVEPAEPEPTRPPTAVAEVAASAAAPAVAASAAAAAPSRVAWPADEQRPAEEGSAPMPDTSSQGPCACGDALRLRRLLAGADAPQVLGSLDFGELTDLADECGRVAETLQWVMKRQRDLLTAASKGLSRPPV